MRTKMMCTALVLLAGFVVAGCGNNHRNARHNDSPPVIDSIHTSQNSLDYTGTYTGTLPCADCSGIRTELTLNDDGTFTMVMIYEGRSDGNNTMTDSGSYVWNNGGNIIMLNNDSTERYQVGENMLVALDMHGNTITGELANMYILRKR